MIKSEDLKLTKEDILIGIQQFLESYKQRNSVENLSDLANETPSISYIIGQPGSGKSTLRKSKEIEYSEKGRIPVKFSSDEMSKFYKHYKYAIKLLPEERYKKTREFVRPAENIILKTLQENQLDILRESCLDKGEKDYGEIKEFINKGYKVEINILAVDNFESYLSCIERDIKLVEVGFNLRPVAKTNHDRMYEPLIKEILELEKMQLDLEINVFARGRNIAIPALIWSKENNKTYQSAYEAITTEREKAKRKKLSKPEEYLTRIKEARNKINILIINEEFRNNYLKELSALEEEFYRELEENQLEK